MHSETAVHSGGSLASVLGNLVGQAEAAGPGAGAAGR